MAFTSVFKRAIKSLYHIQDVLNLHWIPVHRHWRLNERMYGDLQGRDKAETAAKYGEEQVKVRSFKISFKWKPSRLSSLDLASGLRHSTTTDRTVKQI